MERQNYELKDAYFACTTPYQVIGAISITLCLGLEADLYIFGMFPHYEEVAKRLEKYKIFQKVIPVDCSKIGAPGRVQGFLQMLFAHRMASPFLPKNIAYKTYYSSSRAFPKTILHKVLLDRNSDMTRVVYEDGLGTYAANSHPLNATRMKLAAEKLLGWKLDIPERTSMMANVPPLVEPPESVGILPVTQMPRLAFTEETRHMLLDIFSVGKDDEINEKCIIFDTLRPFKDLTDADYDEIDKCYSLITEYIGKTNVVCKPHPRSVERTNVEIELYKKQELPMEVLYSGMSDIENRILVSYTSTAIFTPVILFDKEPIVISLHRILSHTRSSEIFEPIFEKFKRIYKNPERVVAPATKEQLMSFLSMIEL
ncbi:polysialyltransferase family glycosyltransferase [Roseburia hominis]